MNRLSRRRFFQAAGGALGTIGMSNLSLSQRANQYGSAIAQSTPRKVALLVGVNAYSRGGLQGALNDVELQKQLLIHRFGFNPADVHTLKEEQATRRNILSAFDEYLYEPAQAGDVVVFHFSGHGDYVRESALMETFTRRIERDCIDTSGDEPLCYNAAIAPFRYNEAGEDAVEDIMGHTLLLMRSALARKTDNLTFLLDCCYAGGGKRGNAVMRAIPNAISDQLEVVRAQVSDVEWETQQDWLARLGWSEDDFVDAIASPVGPGFFAGAAAAHQRAADYSFDGFVAGAFTYLLTQYLWQSTSSLGDTIRSVASSATRLSSHKQSPDFEPRISMNRNEGAGTIYTASTPIYHAEPTSQPAEALILGAGETAGLNRFGKEETSLNNGVSFSKENRIQLWLGGLDPQRLEAFDQGAVFSILKAGTNESIGDVRQVAGTRRGLTALGEVVASNKPLDPTELSGTLLQEKTRGIPDQVVLKIALDDTLSTAEQQTILSELGPSNDFAVGPAEPGQSAHVLIGRYTEAIKTNLKNQEIELAVEPTIGSVGLFSPTQEPILTGSFGFPSETMSAVVQRLKPRLTSLHIGRMLALMNNGQVSKINVSAEVNRATGRGSRVTTRGSDTEIIIPQQSERGVEEIAAGERFAVSVANKEAFDLHFGVLIIDPTGAVNVLFPPTSDDENIDVILGNGNKVTRLRAQPPYGIVEVLVLASPQSLAGPLSTLRKNAPKLSTSGPRGEADTPTEPQADVSAVEVMSDLFGAMGTQRNGADADVIEGTRLLDVDDVAVLSLLVDIVPA